MNNLPSTAVISPPAWPALDGDSLPSTAVLPEETAVGLDPNESDEAWEARVLAACAPRNRKVLALRD